VTVKVRWRRRRSACTGRTRRRRCGPSWTARRRRCGIRPHDTARHLAQYTSLDAEFGFADGHHDVMAMLREVMAGMVAGVRARAAAAVELLGLTLPEVPPHIPEIHFTSARRPWEVTIRARPMAPSWSRSPRPGGTGRAPWAADVS
jgi:tRNA synthetases class II (D, K and N)